MPVEISRSILMRIEIQPLAPCRKDTDYPAMPSKTFVLELPTGEGIAVQGATLVPRKGPAEQP